MVPVQPYVEVIIVTFLLQGCLGEIKEPLRLAAALVSKFLYIKEI